MLPTAPLWCCAINCGTYEACSCTSEAKFMPAWQLHRLFPSLQLCGLLIFGQLLSAELPPHLTFSSHAALMLSCLLCVLVWLALASCWLWSCHHT
jgi:hypothetical protein